MATTLQLRQSAFHPGETAVHNLLHVPQRNNPTAAGFPANYAHRVALSPLVAFGTLDADGRPWTTVWGGEAGFAQQVESGVPILSVDSRLVDARHDPVVKSLFDTTEANDEEKDQATCHGSSYQISQEAFQSGAGAKLMSGLSIDLATRDRVKLAGRLLAGTVVRAPGAEWKEEAGFGEATEGRVNVRMFMQVDESLGNCPKYLNKKQIYPRLGRAPRLVSDDLPLPDEAIQLLNKADLFFLSSTDGSTMDTNHRGGPRGFVRVLTNSHEDGVTLIYPEYSGNRLYQTLGNLHVHPLVGVCVPDLDDGTGDALYLTGSTRLLVGADAARLLPHTKLAVAIHVTSALFVRDSLPFRGVKGESSPYNPPVRRLAREMGPASGPGMGQDVEGEGNSNSTASSSSSSSKPPATATLVSREELTPTIARFTFRLATNQPLRLWEAGQHVTLDFSGELDVGWSHMRDDDPASLNDDFVRTFTVSNEPPRPSLASGVMEDGTEVQITARRHGPVTGLLWRWDPRVPLEVGLLGFGGEEGFRLGASGESEAGVGEEETVPVFIAAGVGITPLLAQAPGWLRKEARLKVLWSLKAEDLPFAMDVFGRNRGLAGQTTLFVTGTVADEDALLERLAELGFAIVKGRMTRDTVLPPHSEGKRRYHLCTGPEMLKMLLEWLNGEEVVYESFEY